MNKKELIDYVADKSGLSKVEAGKAYDALVDCVMEALSKGEEVKLVGFGTFSVSERKAREGHHPRNGTPIKIPASRAAKFQPGALLKKALNPGEDET